VSAIGVLVMAYGGPGSLEEVEPYLKDVRGWRPTPDPVIRAVRERYAKIGGRSPIRELTEAQAAALQRALDGDGGSFRAIVGMRHWHPYISDALVRLEEQGITRAVGVVMAPHFSRLSVARYYEEVAESKSGVEIAPIESWHLLPGYVDALAERVGAALARFPAGDRATVPVVFTAHSLPQRVREWDDPYPRQLEETRCSVLDRIGPRSSRFAFQSAGMSPEPWLGPDVGEVLDELAAEGHRSVLVAPIGFVCDHVEVLYDLDIVLQERARVLGVRLERTEMLNDAPAMIGGLAGLVRDTAGRAGWM